MDNVMATVEFHQQNERILEEKIAIVEIKNDVLQK